MGIVIPPVPVIVQVRIPTNDIDKATKDITTATKDIATATKRATAGEMS